MPFTLSDPTRIPPRDWLYARHYIRRYVSATIAPGGMGKTSLALAEAVAMCTGRNLLGQPVREKLRVWFWSGEDPLEEVERRLAAICLHYHVSGEEIGGRLFINSGRDFPIRIATMRRAELLFDQAIITALMTEMKQKRIDVLTIDPLVSSHGVPENDNTNIDRVIKEGFGAVANATNSAIDLLHHVRKADRDQTSYTVDDARGASAIIGAVRSARVLNSMTSAQAGAAGLEEDVRRQYFRVVDGKANMSPLSPRPKWFHLASIALGNMTETMPEDFVGVVCPFVMPSAFDNVQVDDVRRVQQRIAAGIWAFHPSAANWAGIAIGEVLDLNPADVAGKAKIAALLAAWIKSGALKIKLLRIGAAIRT